MKHRCSQFLGFLPASPARKGGRGLKHCAAQQRPHAGRIARPQGRAWIETRRIPSVQSAQSASPARKGGRGLKLHEFFALTDDGCIARPQGRAWIETWRQCLRPTASCPIARPQGRAWIETKSMTAIFLCCFSSPARKGGRGLKRAISIRVLDAVTHRPPARAGVD